MTICDHNIDRWLFPPIDELGNRPSAIGCHPKLDIGQPNRGHIPMTVSNCYLGTMGLWS